MHVRVNSCEKRAALIPAPAGWVAALDSYCFKSHKSFLRLGLWSKNRIAVGQVLTLIFIR
jgi:hypothetical protein